MAALAETEFWSDRADARLLIATREIFHADVRSAQSSARDQGVLRAWAHEVDPPESMRWDLRPKMGYLEGLAEGG